jgi:hypothetical protein
MVEAPMRVIKGAYLMNLRHHTIFRKLKERRVNYLLMEILKRTILCPWKMEHLKQKKVLQAEHPRLDLVK